MGRLLERVREAGVVLDFMMLAATNDGGVESQHREAAATFLHLISAEYGLDHAVRLPGLSGRRISVDDFYGWHFDRGARRLRIAAKGSYVDARTELYQSQPGVKGSLSHELGSGPYRWCDDDDPNNAMWIRDEMACAYAHAFVDPPYSVRAQPADLEVLFLAVDDMVLQRPGDDAEIWWWEGGDWADYFLPGLEWWGAWICTIRTTPGRFVAIGASSSD